MKQHLRMKAFGDVETPAQAIDAKAREITEGKPEFWGYVGPGAVVPWSWLWYLKVSKLFRTFQAGFIYERDKPQDDVWDDAENRIVRGKRYLAGDCDDFEPEFARVAMAKGKTPRGAIRPTVCSVGRGDHMVSSIATSHGTLIACNIVGFDWMDSPRFAAHRWGAYQECDGTWRRARPLGLDEILNQSGESNV